METLIEQAKKIKCLVCDVDGVLTDGHLYFDQEAMTLKAFHVQDGFGLQLLMQSGIDVAIITSCNSLIVKNRMNYLGIKHLYQGQKIKVAAFDDLSKKLNLSDEQFAYVGDDLPDLPLIKRAGLGVAVNNAVPLIAEQANWITEKSGGHGAVREVCDLLLHAQGHYAQLIEHYHATQ